MDRQSRVDHARHPCGATCRIFREPTVPTPDLEPASETPPSAQAVCSALIRAGCNNVVERAPMLIVCVTRSWERVTATGTAGGWLITGGSRGMLNYGAPDAAALTRFPEVLASVEEHARHLEAKGVR